MRRFRCSYDIASKIQEVGWKCWSQDVRSSQETCYRSGRLLAVSFDCQVFNKKQIKKWRLSRGSIRRSRYLCSMLAFGMSGSNLTEDVLFRIIVSKSDWKVDLKKYLRYFLCAPRLITNSAVPFLITRGELGNFKRFVINVFDNASAEH